jgi:hypothetical protein
MLLNTGEIMERYKPEQVKVLLIAEAPGAAAPGNENRHFYLGNTNLYRTIYTAFTKVFGEFSSAEEFFELFKSLGFYLDHLSQLPINISDRTSRKAARELAVFSLGERLKVYQPEYVVIIMIDIQAFVNQAINISEIESVQKVDAIPYPAGSETNRKNCITAIVNLLKNGEVDY